MSTHGTNDSQETQQTLDEQINEVMATADENGKLTFDEGVDPLFKRACVNEQKARQHQAHFTKSRQENASLKATNEVLNTQLTNGSQLSAEQADELEDLKHIDPEAWYVKKQQYEKEALATQTGQLKELTDEASQKALSELTLNERQSQLAEFQERTGLTLTDDVMQNDIPPRIQAKMATMPFADYLATVATYLGKGKKVKDTDEGVNQTNLEKLNGGSNGGQGRDYASTAKLSPDGIL